MSHGPTIDALVERCRPETHTFHLPHGECTITLEDVAMIFGLRTHGLPVTGSTDHNTSGDKYGISVHWKYLPLLRDFSRIQKFSWGSACLAHMYQSLCRASRYDCKDIDGPMSLLLVWALLRMPSIGLLPMDTSFPLVRRWSDYQSAIEQYKNWTTADVRRRLDDLSPDGFVWDTYSPNRIAPHLIPFEINDDADLWSGIPLIGSEDNLAFIKTRQLNL
ncbi:uncharacterized protein DS421_19g649300 [Arachis hypogaea]|uniref:Aminotransferase-like plant mobile domain-containing protein n=1 Tax=Arachis hypogaea TaxID=3818 RepID=A0A6B9V6L5_ARAHY|nr:uncharacterized protein DS421_19g649300 [Arachis hypogaea]